MRNQSLELPRETREESARVELGRHRASPRHDGADDAAQDLSFRHAVIIRPHSKRCRTRAAPPTMKTCVTTAPTITPASISAPNPLAHGIKSRNAFTIFPVEPEADCVPSVKTCLLGPPPRLCTGCSYLLLYLEDHSVFYRPRHPSRPLPPAEPARPEGAGRGEPRSRRETGPRG